MKRLLAIVAGVLSGGIAVALVESIGHMIWPPPEGIDITNPEDLAAIMDTIPTAAIAAVLVAWIMGALVGGFAAKKLDKSESNVSSLVTGVVLMTFGIATMIAIPHPIWMWILGVITPIPAALYGARLASPASDLT